MQTITHNHQEIPITGNSIDDAINSPIFSSWIGSLDTSFTINSILIESVDKLNHNDQVFLIKLKVDLVLPSGVPFIPIIILRHRAVAGLCVLTCEDKKYIIVVNQLRIPVGKNTYELPAGMIDDTKNPAEVILREFEEEVQLETILGITADMIKPLGNGGYDSSPGFTNEDVCLFYLEKTITVEQFNELQDRNTGLVEEGESIAVKIIPYDDVIKYCNDTKTLAALYLYEHRI
jgi:8-oxo-dGTP pyrophosphatase MutT (NUDIX family)